MNKLSQDYNPRDYWEQRLSRNFSVAGVGNISFGLQYNKWMHRARLRCLNRILQRCSVQVAGSEILDIGCGTGLFIDYWKAKGAKFITGLDITEKSVTSLQAKYPDHKFIRADISQNQLALEGKFDIITAFDVFFHIVDEAKFESAIANIKRLAKPTTLIFITDFFLKYYTPPRGHEYDRTFTRYKSCLEAQGFEILNKIPLYILMNSPLDIKSELVRKWLDLFWINFMRIIRKSQAAENIAGSMLYCIDGILTKFITDGPTSELMLCKLAS